MKKKACGLGRDSDEEGRDGRTGMIAVWLVGEVVGAQDWR